MTSVDRIQGLSGSLAVKAPVRAATTAAITLSGEQTVDGVAVAEGDRVLVKNQASSVDNGIYDVSSGGWTRSLDFDGSNDVVDGTLVPVAHGTLWGQKVFQVAGANPITPGTSAITLTASLALGEFPVPVAQGGTGAATAAAARAALGVSQLSSIQYGTTGDGTADDMAEITAAVAAAAGGRLLIPAGTYKLPFTGATALTPPANCVIEGEGPGVTILRFEPSSTSQRSLFANSAGNFTLRNLSVQVVVPSTGIVIFFSLSSNGLVLENCDIDGGITNSGATLSHTAHMIGVPLSGAQTDVRLDRCAVHRFNYGWLKASASTAANRRISATDCDFYGNYNEDWSFNSPAGTLDGVQVSSCRFREGAGRAASISQIYCGFASVTDFSVTGCVFEGDADDAIHLEENCRGGSITGNSINTDGVGIYLTDNNQAGSYTMPQHITITGNTLRKADTANSAGSYGISLVYDGSSEVPAKGITVSGNTMVDYEIGLLSGATLDDCCVITGNIADACTKGFQLEYASFAASGNVSKGCTTGLYNSTWGAVDGHVFSNCTTNVDCTNGSITLTDPVFLFPEFSAGAGSTTYKNLLALGANDRVHGFLNVAVASNVTADRGPRQDEVTWDGTTFTRTNKITEISGAIAVDSVRNSSILAAQVFATNALDPVVVQAILNGMVVVAA